VMIENPSWEICSDSLKPLAQWPWIKKTSIYFKLMVVQTKKIRISEAVNPYQLLSID
jgi:hypothetical protein